MKLNSYAKLGLFLSIVSILAGAFVRATGSGDGCGATWPTCKGRIIPALTDTSELIEFSHRSVSGLLLVVTLIIFSKTRKFQKGSLVKSVTNYLTFFVIFEAIIGAIIVLFEWVGLNSSLPRIVAVPIHLVNTFGLLGCYLACWPRDEIEFPLILIRKWPVAWIALFKFGLEVWQYPTSTSNIAHLAHITGFIACYVLAKPIAKGGLIPIGTIDGGPSSKGGQEAQHNAIKSRMNDLSTDPWDGKLTGPALRTLQRLREEGDEIETRQAWLEQLSEQAQCPVCGADLMASEVAEITVLRCSVEQAHLDWP